MWNVDADALVAVLVPVVTVWREASGEGTAGLTAVAHVILNRSKYRKQTVNQVCLAKWQFSSMNAPGDAGMLRWPAADDSSFQQAYQLWTGCASGAVADPTSGADLYYATTIVQPSWTKNAQFLVQIGRQRFYREL